MPPDERTSLSALKPSPSDEADKLRKELGELVKKSLLERDQKEQIGDEIKVVAERITKLVPETTPVPTPKVEPPQ